MSTVQIEIPEQQIKDFCKRWKIIEFSLFGSVLRDDFRPDSDVDLLVEFAPEAEWDYWVGWPEMINELEAMFGRKVDFVERQGLNNPPPPRNPEDPQVLYDNRVTGSTAAFAALQNSAPNSFVPSCLRG